jgi:hypothetical protein
VDCNQLQKDGFSTSTFIVSTSVMEILVCMHSAALGSWLNTIK